MFHVLLVRLVSGTNETDQKHGTLSGTLVWELFMNVVSATSTANELARSVKYAARFSELFSFRT